jgi:hypothetical protein
MPRPSHPPCFDHPNNVGSSWAPCSRTPSIYVLPLVWETKFHTHTKQQVELQVCVF